MAIRAYPHPSLVVPTTFKTRRDTAYSRLVSSRAAFDVTDEGERELLEEAFAFRLATVPTYAFGRRWRYIAEVMADAPQAYFRVGDVTGVPAHSIADSSGNGHVAAENTIAGAGYPLLVAGGTPDSNGAAKLSDNTGANSGAVYSAVNTFNPWSANDHTWEYLFKETFLAAGAGKMTLASASYSAGQANPYIYHYDIAADNTNITLAPAGNAGPAGGGTWNNPYNGDLVLDRWYHIAFTWTHATSTSELYVDGVSKGTKAHSAGFGAIDAFLCWVGSWFIGSHVWVAIGVHIDELAIWQSKLSAARIAAHAAAMV